MLSTKLMYDGLCEGLDLNKFLSLVSKVIEASGYIVDVTIKHVANDNKAFQTSVTQHVVVAINNEGMDNKKCDVIAFLNLANNAYQLVCKGLQKIQSKHNGTSTKNSTIPN